VTSLVLVSALPAPFKATFPASLPFALAPEPDVAPPARAELKLYKLLVDILLFSVFVKLVGLLTEDGSCVYRFASDILLPKYLMTGGGFGSESSIADSLIGLLSVVLPLSSQRSDILASLSFRLLLTMLEALELMAGRGLDLGTEKDARSA